jgi:type IV pilus assembly protein PilB
MATASTASNLSGLALRLVRDNLLSPADAERIQTEALSKKTSFVSQLVESKKLDSATIAKVASEDFGIPLYEINSLDLEMAPVKLVDEKIIRRHHVLPLFKRGTRLFVAVADPTNLQALDEIKFHTGLGTEPILVEEAKLAVIIEKSLDAQDTSLADLSGDDSLENLEIVAGEEDEAKGPAGGEEGVNDAPVVKFVNKVLMDAINRGASDIHIEPYEKIYRVRYRQDGILHEVANPQFPCPRASPRASRFSPGSISRNGASRRTVVSRCASRKIVRSISASAHCRRLWGEKIVMRILDPTSATLGVEKLGFEDFQKQLFLEAIHRPYGMVLVTGPTGSGKTVTLYTAVNILNTSDTNISTAEDPVEINLSGVNQVNINDKAGLNFASALRAFLRQDPDVILVGEIRDLETAEIAIKAAQTGHMVLSTLHTNDAPSTLTRLANMGVPPFNIASAVNLIIAQRLARRLCAHCKKAPGYPQTGIAQGRFQGRRPARPCRLWPGRLRCLQWRL